MKIFMCISMILFGLTFIVAESAPQELVDFVEQELSSIGSSSTIIQAVERENAQGKTLNQIQTLDEQWKNTAGIADYMRELMESECGVYLQGIQDDYPFIAEIFVMDNQGANVAMTDKTSDYWQGDEAKFIQSYNNGNGAVFIDEVEFDDSTQSYLVQASFPVMKNNRAIGAITVGIDIDLFEE